MPNKDPTDKGTDNTKKNDPTKKAYTPDQLKKIHRITESYERHGHDYEPDPADQKGLTAKDIKKKSKAKK